jgi:hypothetical protein
MQTINQKPPAPGDRVGYFGISRREFVALAKFSNAAEKIGLETTGISKGPFGGDVHLKCPAAIRLRGAREWHRTDAAGPGKERQTGQAG